MIEPMHSEADDSKEPLLSELVKEELIVEDGLKEEPYLIGCEAVEENSKEKGSAKPSAFESSLGESIHSGPLDDKELWLSPAGGETLKEASYQDEIRAMVEESIDERISENAISQLHSQVTTVKGCKDSMISKETSVPLENNLTGQHITKQGIFSCSPCSKTYKSEKCFERHISTHGKSDYECIHASELDRHFIHSTIKQFRCSDCDYESNKKSYLKKHTLIHSKSKLFKCSGCNYECNQKIHLKQHMLTHSNVKQFNCSDCDYRCNQKINLKQHILTHSNIKQFKCSVCDYECARKGNLKLHMLTHSNIKQFRCSDCDYVCNLKSNLQQHMLTHSNVKQFKCSDCSYECNRKSHLKRHMLTHSNIKLFRCSECDYECNQKGYLNQHMLTHSAIKQFKCSNCNYECNRKSHLQRHMLTHSNTVREYGMSPRGCMDYLPDMSLAYPQSPWKMV